MKGAISGEKAQKLFEDYANYVYRGALFLTQSKEIADDITQEVFMQVIRKYHTFDEKREIKPWLYKIMLNKVRNAISRSKYMETLDNIAEVVLSEGIEDDLIKQEENKALWKQIEKLSLRTKEVIYMHYYLEMTLEEVAGVLEIPLGTCKSRLNTGLNKLRDHLNTEVYVMRGGKSG